MSDALFRCRSCGSDRLHLVLSLGKTPLANALLTGEQLDQPEDTYPLDVVFCETCTLVQITETVPPARLFSDYAYFSSFSDAMLRHAETLVERMIATRHLGPDSLAAEIASNDGYLLQYYLRAGVPVLGIEPAANIAKVAEARGIRTVVDFFGAELAGTLRAQGMRADVLHANNVAAHVPDLPGFATGIRTVLSDTGSAVIEVPYVKDLIDHCEFDTIYHEHLSYFSLTALHRLFSREGLEVQEVVRIPIHGGSLRVTAGLPGSRPVDPSVQLLLEQEEAVGYDPARVLSEVRSVGQRAAGVIARRAVRPARAGQTDRSLRCRGEGKHAPELLRHRARFHRLRRRSQSLQAGAVHAGRAPAHLEPGSPAGRSAGRRAPADVELRR